MRWVTARKADQAFSRVLGEAESGDEVVITRRGKPVAILRSYSSALASPERRVAVERAIELMENAPAVGQPVGFSREEIHEERAEELDRRRRAAKAS
jgi:prevent-host-death family protein